MLDFLSILPFTICDKITGNKPNFEYNYKIREYAFYGCKNLKTVEFLDEHSIQSIGNNAFAQCSSLESFILPSSIKSIEEKTFYNCSKLSKFVILRDSLLNSIGIRAFGYCSKLHIFFIPNDIKSIQSFAFEGCIELEKIYYYGIKEPKVAENSFSGCTNFKEIYVTEFYQNNLFGGIKIKRIPLSGR